MNCSSAFTHLRMAAGTILLVSVSLMAFTVKVSQSQVRPDIIETVF